MAGKTVSFDTNCVMVAGEITGTRGLTSICLKLTGAIQYREGYVLCGFNLSPSSIKKNLYESHVEQLVQWLSCNGEVWGVGPTTVFASAAALFLYNELEASFFVVGDHVTVSPLERTLVSTMVLGMLALMIHVWVCSMRFFQYYLDTLIRDSPNMLLEMTTAGLLGGGGGGGGPELALGPLTRFLRTQQPQIHITLCWFLSLCYADYVRKNYCQQFNMPYMEQWQSELHTRARRAARSSMRRARSFVGSVHRRLTGATQLSGPNSIETNTVGAQHRRHSSRQWGSAEPHPEPLWRGAGEPRPATQGPALPGPASAPPSRKRVLSPAAARSCPYGYSHSPARLPWTLLRNSEVISSRPDACAAVHKSPGSLVLPPPPPRRPSDDDFPWRTMAALPQD